MSLRGRPGRTHGQAIVEFALIAPLVLLLVLGCVDLSVMGSDKVIAVSAARHGARVASELGGSTLVPANVNSCKGTKPVNQSSTALMVATDQTIVQTVLGAFANASFVARTIVVASKVQALPDEIVVYHRTPPPYRSTSSTAENSTAEPIQGRTGAQARRQPAIPGRRDRRVRAVPAV